MKVEEKYDLTNLRMWLISGETMMIVIMEDGDVRFYE